MPDIDLYINFDGVGKILRYRDSVFYAVLNGIEQALPLDSCLRVQYSTDNSNWHDSAATGDKYIRVSTDSGATWQSGIRFAGVDGTNGITYTPYTAYASDDAGTGFSLTWNDTLKYFATVHSQTVLASPTLSDFTTLGAVWKKFIGDPGQQGNPGNPGATYYPYTAYASSADGTGFSLTWNDTLKYTATVFSTSVIASPTLSDFTNLEAVWKKFIGDDGSDADATATIAAHNTATDAHADKFAEKVSADLSTYTAETSLADSMLLFLRNSSVNNKITLGTLKTFFANAVGTVKFEVVATLPETGESNIIYLVPKSGTPPAGDVKDEYIYLNGAWELIGSTSVDLSAYYTSAQTDTLLNGKSDTGHTHNYLSDAPADGKIYGRKDGGWSEASGDSITYVVDGFTIYVSSTGSDTTGDGTESNPFATLAKAWEYSKGFRCDYDNNKTIKIKLLSHITETCTLSDHPNGRSISIECNSTNSKTLSSVVSCTGSAGAYTAILQLNNVTDIEVGNYAQIQQDYVSGGTNSMYLCGISKITAVDTDNSRVTIALKSVYKAPSGAISGTIYFLKYGFQNSNIKIKFSDFYYADIFTINSSFSVTSVNFANGGSFNFFSESAYKTYTFANVLCNNFIKFCNGGQGCSIDIANSQGIYYFNLVRSYVEIETSNLKINNFNSADGSITTGATGLSVSSGKVLIVQKINVDHFAIGIKAWNNGFVTRYDSSYTTWSVTNCTAAYSPANATWGNRSSIINAT